MTKQIDRDGLKGRIKLEGDPTHRQEHKDWLYRLIDESPEDFLNINVFTTLGVYFLCFIIGLAIYISNYRLVASIWLSVILGITLVVLIIIGIYLLCVKFLCEKRDPTVQPSV